jgi:predicted DNA-binding transcriptional regulator YafY
MTDEELAAVVVAARRLFGLSAAPRAPRADAASTAWRLAGRLHDDDRHALQAIARARSRWSRVGRLRD